MSLRYMTTHQAEAAHGLAEKYENGATLSQLSEQSHLSVPEVRQQIVDAGVPIRSKGSTSSLDPKQRDSQIKILYLEENKTLQEIGTSFGLTRERVRQILRNSGVESLGRRPRAADDKLTRKQAKIAKLYDEGTPPSTLMTEYGINYPILQAILKRAGVKTKPKGYFNRRPDYEKIRGGIVTDYLAGVDTGVIAARYGLCGRTEIYKFIKREGVEPRVASRRKRT